MADRLDVTMDRRHGRVLGLTRAGIWVLAILAAANGLFLYFLPAQAETHYAWSIKPPVNAAFIGAGFLAGTLATGPGAGDRDALAHVRDAADRAVGARELAAARDDRSTTTASSSTTRRPGCGRSCTARCRSRSRSSSRASAASPTRSRTPTRGCNACALARRVIGARHARRRDRAVRRARRPRPALAVAADAAARPRRRRLVRAVRDDARQLRDRHAAPGRGAHPLRDARELVRAAAPAPGRCTPTTSAAAASGIALHGRAARARGLRAQHRADRRAESSKRRCRCGRAASARALQRGDGLFARDRRAGTPAAPSSADRTTADRSRIPLRDSGSRRKRRGGRPSSRSLAAAGARAASTVRILAARTATRAPTPHVHSSVAGASRGRPASPPATTAATRRRRQAQPVGRRARAARAGARRCAAPGPRRSPRTRAAPRSPGRRSVASAAQVGEQPRQRELERDHPRDQRRGDEEAAALGAVAHAQPRARPRRRRRRRSGSPGRSASRGPAASTVAGDVVDHLGRARPHLVRHLDLGVVARRLRAARRVVEVRPAPRPASGSS